MPNYCRNCILPDTRPGVRLDESGVCFGCLSNQAKASIDWDERAASFRQIIAQAKQRSKGYDCVIPVSGGKDSFWQVVTCLEHGLKPLCMTYAVAGRTALGEENLRELVRLGVDHIDFTVNPDVERRFIEKAFRRTAISGLTLHMGIYSAPINLAVRYDIPLVIYGENTAVEFGTEDEALMGSKVDRRWLRTFGVTNGTTAADWVDEDLSAADLIGYTLPTEEVLESKGVQAIFMGWYFPWNPENSYRVAAAHGFRARAEGARVGHLDYVNIDDDFIAVHHHPKWHKFGITRSWDTLSIEIRHGRLTRDDAIQALRELGDETPSRDIGLFCEYLGMPVSEYFGILEQFRNTEIWSRYEGRWVIDDFLVPNFPWPEDPPLN